jgi:acyl-CoA thioesterase YciA
MQIPTLKETMLPRHTNARGTIFGGEILAKIDLAAYMATREHAAETRLNQKDVAYDYATKAMREVVFIAPVYVGDLVSYYTEVIAEGRTSVTVRVEVEAERFNEPGEVAKVTAAEVVYVAIDQDGMPVPIRG